MTIALEVMTKQHHPTFARGLYADSAAFVPHDVLDTLIETDRACPVRSLEKSRPDRFPHEYPCIARHFHLNFR